MVLDEPRLTRRERQLAAAVKRGCSNREIAARLGLAEQTVRNYLSVVFQKYGVANRTQLAVLLNSRRARKPSEPGT